MAVEAASNVELCILVSVRVDIVSNRLLIISLSFSIKQNKNITDEEVVKNGDPMTRLTIET